MDILTTILSLLQSYGCSLSASYIYDKISNYLKPVNANRLVTDLAKDLNCQKSEELAHKIIDLLLKDNVIEKVSELNGVVILRFSGKAKHVTNVHLKSPTKIAPGTIISAQVDGEVENFTNFKIGG